ncbi:histidine kinase [Marivivens niveibacter]|uniref:Histidine kinase n=1 Tax=Marivivens niveibacter TaxID=1930667 RepID=A0A251WW79_9RHOB|nr:CBS domain-containing protein [Marivivens niveibacter]OUD08632.1 histidine kinase [Marivivens niveibacter]
MLVQNILKTKEKSSIYWLKEDEPVSKAVEIMARERIGTIIVSETGEEPSGILSERDIVREMGKQGLSIVNGPISKIMTANPVTITGDKTPDEALQIMTDGRFRHLPVMEGGKLMGLISIGDVVKARLSQLSMEKDALEGMVMGR